MNQTNQTSVKPVLTVMVAPEQLIKFYLSLAGNLAREGIVSAQINEILSGNVSAECVACGMRFGGEELGELVVSREKPDPKNTKFSRLILGYCGRNGCESRLYNVHFTRHPLVDWKKIVDQVENIPDTAETSAEPVVPVTRKSISHKKPLLWILGFCVVYLLYYVMQYFTEGRIPLIQPKHTYQVAPSPVKAP